MKKDPRTARWYFIKSLTAFVSGSVILSPFTILKGKSMNTNQLVGHGDFMYKVDQSRGNLYAGKTPVKNCHGMVVDSRGRLIMVTDETKDSIIIYDKSGKLLDSRWHEFPGGHGLTLWEAGGEEFLFM